MKKILIALIQFYRKNLSPLKSTKCPYYPTCSEYGLEAVEKYGPSGAVHWLYGGYCDVILSQKEGMIPFRNCV